MTREEFRPDFRRFNVSILIVFVHRDEFLDFKRLIGKRFDRPHPGIFSCTAVLSFPIDTRIARKAGWT